MSTLAKPLVSPAQPNKTPAAHSRKHKLTALLTALTLIFGCLTALSIRNATPAQADTTTYGNLGYPYANKPCEHSPYTAMGGANYCSNYDWGPIPDTQKGWSEADSLDPNYGSYGYRNCTDYVAWQLATYGVPAADYVGLGNGGSWYDNAKSKGLVGVGTTPQLYAAAVVPGSPGHVAFLTNIAYGPDKTVSTITVQEYNHDAAGDGDTWTGVPSKRGFSEYVYFGSAMTNAPSSSSPPPPPPLLTSLVTSDGVQHVYSGTATGSLFETWWGPSSPSPTTWQIANVGSAITGISAQVTTDGTEHVYYGTAGGTVGEVWWNSNSGGVHNGQSYNIAAAVTALSSQVTPDGVQHIYSADAAGSLFETWWGSGPAITSQIYNTGVDIVSISSQVTADGTEHLFFGATNGEVGEVWWGATSGGGHLGFTANVGTNVTAVSSQITADSVRHIYSANSVGGLDETWWGPTSSGPTTWQVANVGYHPTSISSQITNDGIEHIYYGTSFGQFGEVWWNANGVHLGQGYSDPAGVSDSAVSSQLTAGGTQQNVYAVNTAGTLFALWWSSGTATTSAIGQVS